MISFKSVQETYNKEKLGKKPNTTRFTDDWDSVRWGDFSTSNEIKIINADNVNESFTRTIVDKTIYKNLAIISWKHQRDKQ